MLKPLSQGMSTTEVADALAHPEQTIKNAVHDLTTRLQLRNRTHAVAHTIREGLI